MTLAKPFEINLDDETEVKAFYEAYATRSFRQTAKALGFSGKGSAINAGLLKAYAINKVVAIDQRNKGNIQIAEVYEKICEEIYSDLPESLRW